MLSRFGHTSDISAVHNFSMAFASNFYESPQTCNPPTNSHTDLLYTTITKTGNIDIQDQWDLHFPSIYHLGMLLQQIGLSPKPTSIHDQSFVLSMFSTIKESLGLTRSFLTSAPKFCSLFVSRQEAPRFGPDTFALGLPGRSSPRSAYLCISAA